MKLYSFFHNHINMNQIVILIDLELNFTHGFDLFID